MSSTGTEIDDMTTPSLAESAHTIATILGVIVRMSDDVENAVSLREAQGKLLKLQRSLQNSTARIRPHIQVALDAVNAEREAVQSCPGN